jgi:hypothetical protein
MEQEAVSLESRDETKTENLEPRTLMNDSANSDPKRELLRHALATVAYRGGKAIRDAPEGFSEFQAGQNVRKPGRILAHIGDLMDWGLSIAVGQRAWHDSEPLPWEQETKRFFGALKKLDDFLASIAPLHASPEKLLQGPIADALTHIGQLATLRRLAAGPIKGESYYEAEITLGRVGAEQPKPKREF